MAGHSHFKNMMHRKGRADKIRSKLFTKLSREITVSAKLGTPDPEMNPRLRAAVQAARAANMPKDNMKEPLKNLKAISIIVMNFQDMRALAQAEPELL